MLFKNLSFFTAEHNGHSHMLFGIVEKGDSGFTLKPLKQKQMIDGLCYLLQEIYGIENKDNERSKVSRSSSVLLTFLKIKKRFF